jgi:UDP-glucose 4-epimerase
MALETHRNDPRLHVVRANAGDVEALTATIPGHDWVIHLAANPDIARAEKCPEIDFYQGTLLTNNVLEAMRRTGVLRILYASGSGVYGDAGDTPLVEDYSPLMPISPYGASKLAGEALIASYCAMFGMQACALRFGNIVGARQTHGVALDFLRSLAVSPQRLSIRGDGRQSKPYIHASDAVQAALCAILKASGLFRVFNVATDDSLTVTEIAEMVVEALGVPAPAFAYSGGSRGWRGDVPTVRLDSTRAHSLGWFPKWNSWQAMRQSLQELIADERTLRN